MQWIDEKDLERWSHRADARVLLADMVSGLIRATISDASRFRFPGGDVGQVRGWDGDLETAEAVFVIPAGKSKWEFGVGAGAKKASDDYEKRSKKTDPAVMKENTLVLVNLNTWDTPREMLAKWEDDRIAEGKWAGVKYLDAVSLVHWLNRRPAVAAHYAREVLQKAPKVGALSTDEFWDMYSFRFKPQLHEKVVVADRHSIAEDLIQKLLGPAQSVMIGAETPEEVVAFTVAAIRLAEPAVRRSIEMRTLIVETDSAARFLCQQSGMIFITTKDADAMAGVLAKNAPTVSAATGMQARKANTPFLQRPSASRMGEGFVAMGLDHQAGYELAHRCGRSLTILKRLIPNGPSPSPAWEAKAAELKPAFLAGGWSAKEELDRKIIRGLSGLADYAAFEAVLYPTLTLPDPPLDRLNEIWQVRAPVDAFSVYGQLLSEVDLTRFREAVIQVFGHVVAGPSRDEMFSLTYTPPADYSKWLRDGLALTLLIIATMHEVGRLQMNGTTPQQYVDAILSSLPDWGKRHETLIGLGDQSALFAEAAPNPFLRALESMLEGAPHEAAKIFSTNDDGILGPSSPHINVLWALETLAWDPSYLSRAACVLAKLAELDPNPNSRHVNRPLNSLRAILVSWSPCTHASLPQRIACLDLILSTCPDVGWQLLMKLMPTSHDTSSPTQMPKLRDVAPMVPENLTFGVVWDSEAAIAERAMRATGDRDERIVVLVNHISNFQPETRTKILAFIDKRLSQYQSVEGTPVWHALREELARHEYFAESDWAMTQAERDAIAAVVERHRPTDQLVAERQLFDDWVPHVGRYTVGTDIDGAGALRTQALDRVLSREGTSGILRLARMVRVPSLIGQSLGSSAISEAQLIELLKASIIEATPGDLSFYVSAIGAERLGEKWTKRFKDEISVTVDDPQVIANLLLGWPLEKTTWDFVKSLGDKVYQKYWRRTQVLPIKGSLDDLLYAIGELRDVDRSLDVLCLVHHRIRDIPSDLILSLLSEGQRQLASGRAQTDTMLSYYLNQAFESLQTRDDVKREDIARQEYAYLPLIIHEKRQLVLYEFLSSTPAFFVEVLSHVFRGKNAPSDKQPTEQERARAQVSYRLLSSFRTVPGLQQQIIDEAALNEWVDGVRVCATRADLAKIADQYIGHILAHAPVNALERFWPPSPVCALIERVASKDIENGISIECFNKRGVVSRAMYEGGTLERTDAETYKKWAIDVARYPRTSAVLLGIAETWHRQAEQEDVSAELRKMER